MAEASIVKMETEQAGKLIECTWHDIVQPGAYVDLETGYLYRIPAAALQQRAAPLIRRESTRVSRLIRVSQDPCITTQAARLICCQHNITAHF
jgi:cation transport regulator ChaC